MATTMTTISSVNRAQPLKTITGQNDESNTSPALTTQDQVEISNTTHLMTEAEDIAMNSPDVNEAAVAKARDAIENGELEINYDRLAQKMLDFEFTLFDN